MNNLVCISKNKSKYKDREKYSAVYTTGSKSI